jgi:hypothetical protein
MPSIRRAAAVVIAAMSLIATSFAVPVEAGAIVATCDNIQTVLTASTPGQIIALNGMCAPTSFIQMPPRAITLMEASGTDSGFDGSNLGDLPTVIGQNIQGTRIEGLTFKNGTNTGGGAALQITGDSHPQIIDNTFINNHTTGSSTDGGALKIVQNTPPVGQTVVSGNTFGGTGPGEGNSSGRDGGALVIFGCSNIRVTNNTFRNNTAARDGGGALIFVANFEFTDPAVTVTGNTVTGNVAGGHGGGIALIASADDAVGGKTATVTNNTISGNQAAGGGGGAALSIDNMKLQLKSTTFSNNDVTGATGNPRGGGALLILNSDANPDGMFVEHRNRYIGNTVLAPDGSGSPGGGGVTIVGVAKAPLNINGNLYRANRVLVASGVGGDGGAIQIASTAPPGETAAGVRMWNSIVVSNGVTGQGGGIAADCVNDCTLPVRIMNSTLFGNCRDLASDGTGTCVANQADGDSSAILRFYNSIAWSLGQGADLTGFGSRTVANSDACRPSGAYPGTGNMCADPQLQDCKKGNCRQRSRSRVRNRGDRRFYSRPSRIPGLGRDFYNGLRFSGAQVDIGAHEKQQ